jgi:hypothetical protein
MLRDTTKNLLFGLGADDKQQPSFRTLSHGMRLLMTYMCGNIVH